MSTPNEELELRFSQIIKELQKNDSNAHIEKLERLVEIIKQKKIIFLHDFMHLTRGIDPTILLMLYPDIQNHLIIDIEEFSKSIIDYSPDEVQFICYLAVDKFLNHIIDEKLFKQFLQRFSDEIILAICKGFGSKISSFINLNNLNKELNAYTKRECKAICAAIKDILETQDVFKLNEILKSLSPEKCQIVCETIREYLSIIVTSHVDFSILLMSLNSEQKAFIVNYLPTQWINSSRDLAAALKEMNSAQRLQIINSIDPEIIKLRSDVIILLRLLSTDELEIFCTRAKTQISNILMCKEDYNAIRFNLVENQITIFYKIFQEKLLALVSSKKELESLEPKVKEDEELKFEMQRKVGSFIKIYKALHAGQESLFKTNFIADFFKKSTFEKYTAIIHHAKNKPNSRTAKAWQLAQECNFNVDSNDVGLFKKIYVECFNRSGFYSSSHLINKSKYYNREQLALDLAKHNLDLNAVKNEKDLSRRSKKIWQALQPWQEKIALDQTERNAQLQKFSSEANFGLVERAANAFQDCDITWEKACNYLRALENKVFTQSVFQASTENHDQQSAACKGEMGATLALAETEVTKLFPNSNPAQYTASEFYASLQYLESAMSQEETQELQQFADQLNKIKIEHLNKSQSQTSTQSKTKALDNSDQLATENKPTPILQADPTAKAFLQLMPGTSYASTEGAYESQDYVLQTKPKASQSEPKIEAEPILKQEEIEANLPKTNLTIILEYNQKKLITVYCPYSRIKSLRKKLDNTVSILPIEALSDYVQNKNHLQPAFEKNKSELNLVYPPMLIEYARYCDKNNAFFEFLIKTRKSNLISYPQDLTKAHIIHATENFYQERANESEKLVCNAEEKNKITEHFLKLIGYLKLYEAQNIATTIQSCIEYSAEAKWDPKQREFYVNAILKELVCKLDNNPELAADFRIMSTVSINIKNQSIPASKVANSLKPGGSLMFAEKHKKSVELKLQAELKKQANGLLAEAPSYCATF